MRWAIASALLLGLGGVQTAHAQYNPFAGAYLTLQYRQAQENEALRLIQTVEANRLTLQINVLRARTPNTYLAQQQLQYIESVAWAQLQYRHNQQSQILAYKHQVEWEILRQQEAAWWARINGY